MIYITYTGSFRSRFSSPDHSGDQPPPGREVEGGGCRDEAELRLGPDGNLQIACRVRLFGHAGSRVSPQRRGLRL